MSGFDTFINEVKVSFNNLIDGKCFRNFSKKMDPDDQIKTALKVAAFAIGSAILFGLLFGLSGPVGGVIGGLVLAGTVGLCAFSYFTNDNRFSFTEKFVDKSVESAKESLDMFREGVNKGEEMLNNLFKS